MPSSFHIGVKALLTRGTEVLVLRADSLWDLPGGRVESREQIPDTLMRELAEELPGVQDVAIGDLIGWHHNDDYGFSNRELVLLIFRVQATLPDPIALSDEHDSAIWMPVAEARKVLPRIAIQWERLG